MSYLRTSQSVWLVDPTSDVMKPEGHLVQLSAFFSGLKYPTAHFIHTPFLSSLPGSQLTEIKVKCTRLNEISFKREKKLTA